MSLEQLESLGTRDLIATCLWAEARGEPKEGQQAVCNVILNRVRRGMAPNIRRAILAPRQFSWTSPRDVNHAKALQAKEQDPQGWERAEKIASLAMTGVIEDLSKGADHYLNIEITRKLRGGTLPRWAQKGIDDGRITVVIGSHTFLDLRRYL